LGDPIVRNIRDSLSSRGKGACPKALKLDGHCDFESTGMGPVTHLYSRHLYALLNSVFFLNCWVTLTEEARAELLFWQHLPRLRFDADIWPPLKGCPSGSPHTRATLRGGGGHTMTGPMEIAKEFLSEWEAVQSSSYQELMGVYLCMQSLVHRCEGRFVALQMDAQNLLGIVNRGSPKLIINELARELFWFCLRHRITTNVEVVPREENAFADGISKMLIPKDSMMSERFFGLLNERWGPHTVDLFSSGANNECARFYALHWCMGAAGINAFGQLWTGENY